MSSDPEKRRTDRDLTPTAAQDDSTLPAAGETHCVSERYFDRGEVGRGGMSSVRRVFDHTLLRELALKVLPHPDEEAQRRTQRFIKEAQITAQLDHPYIVPIHELSVDESGQHYFTMKLVQGKTLAAAVERIGSERLSPENLSRLLDVLLKVCDALSFAHSRGVIHRDLKPANIMVGEFGQVSLMDWGVARLLCQDDPMDAEVSSRPIEVSYDQDNTLDQPGRIVGTLSFMPPEQVEGRHEQVDERSDVFSLGATLYHVLTGHPPYRSKSRVKLLFEVVSCDFVPPDLAVADGRVPAELARITMKAMAADPADRFPSVQAMRDDLERFLRGSWHQRIKTFPVGSLIVREGDAAETAYIIVDGRCIAFDDSGTERVVLREMGPGEVFGETAVFAAGVRTASVEAVGEVSLIEVTRETLTTGLGLNSWLGAFVNALAERFSEVDQRRRQLEHEKLDATGEASGEFPRLDMRK
ncbi:MAG: protein kinase [bacterium]|nr:protein kinase [bacterium]